MKITVAIDSFKGSISSAEAAEAVKEAIGSVLPTASVFSALLADGGEGTADALLCALGGKKQKADVTGPLGDRITAEYVISHDNTAIIEMASASGLTLVPEDKRDPLYTTTYGVGELIKDAAYRGARKFIIGLGGSATNDGGAGMLSALGFRLLDASGEPIRRGAVGLSDLKKIDISGAIPELSECSFTVASDVKNPLCGELGASRVFGPQKGATPESIDAMDAWLDNFANLAEKTLGVSCACDEGAGAAGGLGFAFKAFLGAKQTAGIDLVISLSGLENEIANSDLVITGEGMLDGQSGMGKAPIGIARLAKKYGKPVIAFCGAVGKGVEACNALGIDAYFPIAPGPCTLSAAMDKHVAKENLYRTAEQALRLFALGRS